MANLWRDLIIGVLVAIAIALAIVVIVATGAFMLEHTMHTR